LRAKDEKAKGAKEDDELDHFFKSIASTVRKMPPRKIAEVKLFIHQAVHLAEMESLAHSNPIVHPMPMMIMQAPQPMMVEGLGEVTTPSLAAAPYS
jgi:hypothetical protein